MTYAVASALQTAVFAALTGDTALASIVGTDVFDAAPVGALPSIYVVLGAERARDASDTSASGAWHDLTISVVTETAGFVNAKTAAGAVSDVLHDAELTLARGRLISLRFSKAQARRERGGHRRIDLTFRARTEDE